MVSSHVLLKNQPLFFLKNAFIEMLKVNTIRLKIELCHTLKVVEHETTEQFSFIFDFKPLSPNGNMHQN